MCSLLTTCSDFRNKIVLDEKKWALISLDRYSRTEPWQHEKEKFRKFHHCFLQEEESKVNYLSKKKGQIQEDSIDNSPSYVPINYHLE